MVVWCSSADCAVNVLTSVANVHQTSEANIFQFKFFLSLDWVIRNNGLSCLRPNKVTFSEMRLLKMMTTIIMILL